MRKTIFQDLSSEMQAKLNLKKTSIQEERDQQAIRELLKTDSEPKTNSLLLNDANLTTDMNVTSLSSKRKILIKPKPIYNCNEEGIVIIAVSVNRLGKVVKAYPTENSTTHAKCLLKAAENAALTTLWEADPKAAEIETGTVTYNFHFN
jgi:hypothetical protein